MGRGRGHRRFTRPPNTHANYIYISVFALLGQVVKQDMKDAGYQFDTGLWNGFFL